MGTPALAQLDIPLASGRLAIGACRPSCSLVGADRLAIPTMPVEIEATAIR